MAAADASAAAAAPLPSGPPGTELVPESGRGVDLQPDVERIHRAIAREPHDPIEGREPAPWFFVASIALALFWGGWYLGRYGGEFGLATHISEHGRERGIAGVTRRRRRGLTRQARKPVFAPDLIGRDFTAPRPEVRLVGDMTFLPTEEGWLYLATCIDLATREVVGYAMADHHRAELLNLIG